MPPQTNGNSGWRKSYRIAVSPLRIKIGDTTIRTAHLDQVEPGTTAAAAAAPPPLSAVERITEILERFFLNYSRLTTELLRGAEPLHRRGSHKAVWLFAGRLCGRTVR
jgi:hypothetical protein